MMRRPSEGEKGETKKGEGEGEATFVQKTAGNPSDSDEPEGEKGELGVNLARDDGEPAVLGLRAETGCSRLFEQVIEGRTIKGRISCKGAIVVEDGRRGVALLFLEEGQVIKVGRGGGSFLKLRGCGLVVFFQPKGF